MKELPTRIEVRRGGRVESVHRFHAVVRDADGATVARVGDPDALVYPRSAVKPIQALPLVESGAADAFEVTEAELALACASHNSEPRQVELVEAWLERLGLSEAALACGPHPPRRRVDAQALVRAGGTPTRSHNNCSGKHAGMLTLALHLEAPTEGYERPDHPVQRRVLAALKDLCDDLLDEPPGVDGCSLPNWPVSLHGLAAAGVKLVTGQGLGRGRAEASARIVAAMRAHPELVAGEGRLDTELMRAAPGVIAKTGAEGVYLAAHAPSGQGLALKVFDGAQRAAEVALLACVDSLGWLPDEARAALAHRSRPELRNFAGVPVGEIEAVAG